MRRYRPLRGCARTRISDRKSTRLYSISTFFRSKRAAAAAEKTLRQRDGVQWIAGVVECPDIAHFGAAREHESLADGVVSGIAQQEACEVGLRSQRSEEH